MDRRSILKAIGILAGTAALESCAARHVTGAGVPPPPSAPALLKLPKVKVAPDREIRTVVGLRPYRRAGFVVAAQKFDDKLVVHNYGHGGGGVSLSWGTAELACREADSSREKDVAVIARVPFDEGTLTGTLTLDSTWPADDWRNTYFVPENLKSSVEHGDRLKPLLKDGMTMPEMAMRFILNNPDVSTIIPGMRKIKNVESNIAASDKGPLPSALHTELRKHRWDRKPTKWSQ